VTLEIARKVADAVLWEGYVLYPYRKSDGKNVIRWQFGVVMPKDLAHLTSEPWMQQTECLIEPDGDLPRIDITFRFLQVQARFVEAADPAAPGGFRPVERLDVDGREQMAFDEAVEREVTYADIALTGLVDGERELPIGVPSGREVELLKDASGAVVGRFVRVRWNLFGLVRILAKAVGERITVRVVTENLTDWTEPQGADRTSALRRSFVGAHTMLSVRDAKFVSVLDPPADAREAAEGCSNLNTWPVLVGDAEASNVVLSSPIILYDFPQIAPESAGDLFDACEIDEILLLRVLTLTDAEKAEARATDDRARAIIDRADNMPPEVFEKLHGAIRYLKKTPETVIDEAGEHDEEAASGDEQLDAAAAHVASTGAGLRMGWGDAAPSRGGGSPELLPFVSTAPELAPFDPGMRKPTGFERGPRVPPGGWENPGLGEGIPVFTEPKAGGMIPPESAYVGAGAGTLDDEASSFREFFGEASQGPPDIGTIRIGDAEVGKGSRVRINPQRRADAHDMFLVGRAGTVAGIFQDVDGGVHVAVSLEDDPSGELEDWYGRYYYFDPTEVEPLGDEEASLGAGGGKESLGAGCRAEGGGKENHG
jgi:hypothetical protein